MLQNRPALAIGGLHLAENEPPKVHESTEKSFKKLSFSPRQVMRRLRLLQACHGAAIAALHRAGVERAFLDRCAAAAAEMLTEILIPARLRHLFPAMDADGFVEACAEPEWQQETVDLCTQCVLKVTAPPEPRLPPREVEKAAPGIATDHIEQN